MFWSSLIYWRGFINYTVSRKRIIGSICRPGEPSGCTRCSIRLPSSTCDECCRANEHLSKMDGAMCWATRTIKYYTANVALAGWWWWWWYWSNHGEKRKDVLIDFITGSVEDIPRYGMRLLIPWWNIIKLISKCFDWIWNISSNWVYNDPIAYKRRDIVMLSVNLHC